MMSENAKFKLKFSNGEIELEGSEKFVEKQIESIESILSLVGKIVPVNPLNNFSEVDASEEVTPNSSANSLISSIPETFGEWMHQFKSNGLDIDKALITARFVQSQSPTNDFKTSEVNKALKDHGIKLSNPSDSLTGLVKKKFMFQTRKVGVLKYLRVSQDGQNYLESLKR